MPNLTAEQLLNQGQTETRVPNKVSNPEYRNTEIPEYRNTESSQPHGLSEGGSLPIGGGRGEGLLPAGGSPGEGLPGDPPEADYMQTRRTLYNDLKELDLFDMDMNEDEFVSSLDNYKFRNDLYNAMKDDVELPGLPDFHKALSRPDKTSVTTTAIPKEQNTEIPESRNAGITKEQTAAPSGSGQPSVTQTAANYLYGNTGMELSLGNTPYAAAQAANDQQAAQARVDEANKALNAFVAASDQYAKKQINADQYKAAYDALSQYSDLIDDKNRQQIEQMRQQAQMYFDTPTQSEQTGESKEGLDFANGFLTRFDLVHDNQMEQSIYEWAMKNGTRGQSDLMLMYSKLQQDLAANTGVKSTAGMPANFGEFNAEQTQKLKNIFLDGMRQGLDLNEIYNNARKFISQTPDSTQKARANVSNEFTADLTAEVDRIVDSHIADTNRTYSDFNNQSQAWSSVYNRGYYNDVQQLYEDVAAKFGLSDDEKKADPRLVAKRDKFITELMDQQSQKAGTGTAEIASGLSDNEKEKIAKDALDDMYKAFDETLYRTIYNKVATDQLAEADRVDATGAFFTSTLKKTLAGTFIDAVMSVGLSDNQKQINQMRDQLVQSKLSYWGDMASSALALLADTPGFVGLGTAAKGSIKGVRWLASSARSWATGKGWKSAGQKVVRQLVKAGAPRELAEKIVSKQMAHQMAASTWNKALNEGLTLGTYSLIGEYANSQKYGTDFSWGHVASGTLAGAFAGAAGSWLTKATGNAFIIRKADPFYTKFGKALGEYTSEAVVKGTAFALPDLGNKAAKDLAKMLKESGYDELYDFYYADPENQGQPEPSYLDILRHSIDFMAVMGLQGKIMGAASRKKGTPGYVLGSHGKGPQAFAKGEYFSQEAMREFREAGFGSNVQEVVENLLLGAKVGDMKIPEPLQRAADEGRLSLQTVHEIAAYLFDADLSDIKMPAAARATETYNEDGTYTVATFDIDGKPINRQTFTDPRKGAKTFRQAEASAEAVRMTSKTIAYTNATYGRAIVRALNDYRKEHPEISDDTFSQLVEAIYKPKSERTAEEKAFAEQIDKTASQSVTSIKDLEKNLSEQYGVSIRDAAAKPVAERTEEESQALEAYEAQLDNVIRVDKLRQDISQTVTNTYDTRLKTNTDQTYTEAEQDIQRTREDCVNYLGEDTTARLEQAYRQNDIDAVVDIIADMTEEGQSAARELGRAMAAADGLRDHAVNQRSRRIREGMEQGQNTPLNAENLLRLSDEQKELYDKAVQLIGEEQLTRFFQQGLTTEEFARLAPEQRDILTELLAKQAEHQAVTTDRVEAAQEEAEQQWNSVNQTEANPFVTTAEDGTRTILTATDKEGNQYVVVADNQESGLLRFYDPRTGETGVRAASEFSEPTVMTADAFVQNLRRAAGEPVEQAINQAYDQANQLYAQRQQAQAAQPPETQNTERTASQNAEIPEERNTEIPESSRPDGPSEGGPLPAGGGRGERLPSPQSILADTALDETDRQQIITFETERARKAAEATQAELDALEKPSYGGDLEAYKQQKADYERRRQELTTRLEEERRELNEWENATNNPIQNEKIDSENQGSAPETPAAEQEPAQPEVPAPDVQDAAQGPQAQVTPTPSESNTEIPESRNPGITSSSSPQAKAQPSQTSRMQRIQVIADTLPRGMVVTNLAEGQRVLDLKNSGQETPEGYRFFRTKNGDAYGFAYKGKIYLDPRIASANTAVHEYTHLWGDMLRHRNREAWNHLKEQLLGEKEFIDMVQRDYPELKYGTDAFFDEVFAHFSGSKGEERLNQMEAKMAAEQNTAEGRSRVRQMFDRIRQFLNEYWQLARDIMAGDNTRLRDLSARDFADMALSDMLRGLDPRMREATERLETAGVEADGFKGDVRMARADILGKQEREKVIKEIMDVTGRSRATVTKWVNAENSLAKVILEGDNQRFLEMQTDDSVPSIWKNSDYPQGTVEFSNICRKRLPFTMIYQRLQQEFPNHIFDAKSLESIRGIMKENGEEVACGLCFVEDRRQLFGEIGNGFIDAVKGKDVELNDYQKTALEKLRQSGDTYVPNLYDLITLDGLKKLRRSHPEVANAFVAYNNARGRQAGRLFNAYSAYHREILNYNKAKVKSINDNGGLRIFSFSDFEAHHLIDLVQVITDCAAKGIKIQGYTKVPEFARAVKDTGVKLNRSLIAKGTGLVDADYVPQEGEAVSPNVINGKRLLLDCVEGINVNHPDFFDSTNNRNVGNILVGINDEQIRQAMLDPFVDYIIPFHSGLSEEIRVQKGIGDWVNYKLTQLEKKYNEKGSLVNADKHVNIYTDVIPRAEEIIGHPIRNARDFQRVFLHVCNEKGWVPRFYQFLNRNRRGEYVYTPGYEKLLIDFKLFDKNGRFAPQEQVRPIFDNELNKRILDDYVRDAKQQAPNEELYRKIKEGLGLENTTPTPDGPGEGERIRFAMGDSSESIPERWRDPLKLTPAEQEKYLESANKYLYELQMEDLEPQDALRQMEQRFPGITYMIEKGPFYIEEGVMGDNEIRSTDIDEAHGTPDITNATDPANPAVRLSKVTDPKEIERLDGGPLIKVYRSIQLGKDGEMNSPIARKMGTKGNKVTNHAIGLKEWEKADEHPELVDETGHIILDKGSGLGTLRVAYNPYIHTSRSMINDQFASAWKRGNIRVIETWIPESELTAGYQADHAKNSVGEHPWKTGPVGRELPADRERKVILSRWDKPERFVPWEEVADDYARTLQGLDIQVPFNVVPRDLLPLLVERGVKIGPPEKGNAGDAAIPAYREWLAQQNQSSDLSNWNPLQAAQDNVIRMSKARSNSGYTEREDGSALSVRASEAEYDGKFTEGRFRTNYNVSRKGFPVLEKLGIITSNEWHHTGKGFSEKDFYEWGDFGKSDYTEGAVEDGSFADIYKRNKKEIDNLIDDFDKKEWEYKDKEGKFRLPDMDDFKRVTSERDLYSMLSPEELAQRQEEHDRISSGGSNLGTAYERRQMHEEVDRKYLNLAYDKMDDNAWRKLYEDTYKDELEHNRTADERNREIDEYNSTTDGKEKILQRIAGIFGIPEKEAESQIKSFKTRDQRERQAAQQKEADAKAGELRKRAEEEQRQYLDKLLSEGRAQSFTRLRKEDIPEHSVVTAQEMNGRYGWFKASSRYSMPVYYSGYSFKDARTKTLYEKKAHAYDSEIETAQTAKDNVIRMSKASRNENPDIRFSRARQEMFEGKRRYAERKAEENRQIGMRNGLTEEQCDALDSLSAIRHELHVNQDRVAQSDESGLKNRLIEVNMMLVESGLKPIEGVPTDKADYIDIDTIDELSDYSDFDFDPSNQEQYEREYERIIGELNDLNNDIEKYQREIDSQFKTSYAPTGWARLRFSRASGASGPAEDLSTFNPLEFARQNVERATAARQLLKEARDQHSADRKKAIRDYAAIASDPGIPDAEKSRLHTDLIRKVASVQSVLRGMREADKTSVESITKTVAEMADYLTNGLTTGAVRRIMSGINRSMSKRDIQEEVTKAVDIVLNHIQKEQDNISKKLLSTKATKLDAKNIRKAGALEERGQRALRQLRELLARPEADLDQLEAELLDRTESENATVATTAQDQLAGLQLARIHRDNVGKSADIIADLRKQRRELEAQIYEHEPVTEADGTPRTDADGNPIMRNTWRLQEKYKNPTDADKAQRENIQQQINSINEAITEEKVQKIRATGKFNSELGAMLTDSKEQKKSWVQQQKERQDEILHDANSDLMGVSANPYEQKHLRDEREARGKKRIPRVQRIAHSLANTMFAPFRTFDTVLRKLGAYAPQGEGKLWHRFSLQWQDAAEREWKMNLTDNQLLDAKVKELFGDEYKVKHYADIYKICKQLDKQRIKDGNDIWITYKDHTGRETPLHVTTGQALYLILSDAQTDGRMKLRNQGISEEDIETVRDALDPRILQLGEWFVNDFLVTKREQYNEVYRQIYGTDMADNPNYFPIKIFKKGRPQKVRAGEPTRDQSATASTTTSIIERTRNALPLDPEADAFDVLAKHIAETNNWWAFEQMRTDLSTLFSSKRFENQVKNLNSFSLGSGEDLWDAMQTSSAIMLGTYNPPSGTGSRWWVNFSKNVTAAKIAFRPYTAFKQLTSHPAFWSDARFDDVVKALAGGKATWQWAMDNLPVLEKRWKSRNLGDTRLESTELDWSGGLTQVAKFLSTPGMWSNAAIDAFTCAAGAKAVYDTRLRYYEKELGLEHDEADRLAKRDATFAFNESQQSSEGMFVSQIQRDRDIMSVALTTFRNGPMGYGRQLRNTISDLKYLAQNATGWNRKQLLFRNAKLLQSRYGISREAAHKQAVRDYRRRINKDLARLIVFGYVLPTVWNYAGRGLYNLFGDDDEAISEMMTEDNIHGLAGPIEGLAYGNIISDLWNQTVASKNGDISFVSIFPELPFASDIDGIINGLRSKDKIPVYTNLVNLLSQMGTGVNLNILTDAYAAIADAVYGIKNDEDVADEIGLALLRVLQTPQSGTEQLYIDNMVQRDSEGNITGLDANRLEEWCHRYIEYKKMKDSDGFGYKIFDDAMADERLKKRWDKKIDERMQRNPGFFGNLVTEAQARNDAGKKTLRQQKEETEQAEKEEEAKAAPHRQLFSKNAPISLINAYNDARLRRKRATDLLKDHPNGRTEREAYNQWKEDNADLLSEKEALDETVKAANAIIDAMTEESMKDDIERLHYLFGIQQEQ